MRVNVLAICLPGILRLSSHWLPMCVMSAASRCLVIRSVMRDDGSPPILTLKGLPASQRKFGIRSLDLTAKLGYIILKSKSVAS